MAAFGTGCVFILLQACAYAGLIEIKWSEIERRAEAVVDRELFL